jgi:hypothetical protein
MTGYFEESVNPRRNDEFDQYWLRAVAYRCLALRIKVIFL